MTEQPPSKEQTSDDIVIGLAAEVSRLKQVLRGIQSCSTCERCRGAATLALGGFTCLGGCGTSLPGPNAYCSACFLKARSEQRAAREPAGVRYLTLEEMRERYPDPSPFDGDEQARREQLADRLSWPQPVRADLDAAADIIRGTLPPLSDELIDEFLGELDGYNDRTEVVRKWFGGASRPPGDGRG